MMFLLMQRIFTRVGKQYQVEIPPLKSIIYCHGIQKNQHDAKSTFHGPLAGLAFPLFWIKDEVENNKHDPLKHACKSNGVTMKSELP